MNKKQASLIKRFLSWFMDMIIFFICYFLFVSIVMKFIPEKLLVPPVGPMAFYSKGQFIAYSRSLLFLIIFIIFYNYMPLTRVRATLGQLICHIRIRSKNGHNVTFKQMTLRLLGSLIKIIVIFMPGPLMAYFFDADVGSFVALMFGFAFLLFTIVIPCLKADKATWIEKISNTRIFES